MMTPEPIVNTHQAITLIAQASGLPEETIQQKMLEKITKFSGLLTEQGALVLLGKELQVNIPFFEKQNQPLKLGEIKLGMNNIDVHAKIKMLDRIKTFNKNGKEGKYLSVRLIDETGEALYTFWNEQAEEAIQKGARVGSEIKLVNARAGSFNGQLQLSLGYNGSYTIENDGNENNGIQTENSQKSIPFSEVKENQYIQGKAHVVDVLQGKGYYVRCTACGAKLQESEKTCPMCGKEGSVETRLLLSLVLDDGTKPLRGVAFEETTLVLYDQKKEEILEKLLDENKKIAMQKELLGKIIRFHAKTKIGMDNSSVELTLNQAEIVPFESA